MFFSIFLCFDIMGCFIFSGLERSRSFSFPSYILLHCIVSMLSFIPISYEFVWFGLSVPGVYLFL